MNTNTKQILLFSAPWCKACEGMDVIVKEYCTKYNFGFRYVNVDESQEEVNDHEIEKIPTIVFLTNDIPFKSIYITNKTDLSKEFSD